MKPAIKLKTRRVPFHSPGDRRTVLLPFEILFMMKDLLLALKPLCHLSKLVLVISCRVCMFCEVDIISKFTYFF